MCIIRVLFMVLLSLLAGLTGSAAETSSSSSSEKFCIAISRDFSAAYDPLLAMARDLYRIDRSAALQLFNELEQANPARSDARNLRARLLSEQKGGDR